VQLRLRLQAAGVDIAASGPGPRLLGYDPRRRAVVRLDNHVVKIHADERSFEDAVAALERVRALDSVPVVRVEGVVEELQLTCEPMIAGDPADPLDDAADAGSLLAALHASQVDQLRTWSATDQLKAAALAADSASALVPELDERFREFLQTLELTRPDLAGAVPAHGNFHAGQLLRANGGLTATDFDHMCSAPPALDLATFAARAVNGDEDNEVAAAGTLVERLVDGYGSRPRGLAWYLATAILIRSPVPFHLQKPNWPVGIEKMIRAAEGALHL
jgi:aminoglycoside phosphotransferase (APT) family kinase protein